jgi:hypothetical protein
VMFHALLAAAYLEQFVIIVHTPLICETELFESHVERDAVAVSLGINDHAILVEEYRFNLSQDASPECGRQ